MKRRSLIITLALAIASLPSIQAASHEDGDHDHTALEDQMSAMNKAWRSIRRQIKDPAKNDSTLEYVAKVKKAAQKSVDMTPILAKEMSGAEKEKIYGRLPEGDEKHRRVDWRFGSRFESGR